MLSEQCEAAKKTANNPEEEIKKIEQDVEDLTKKIYSSSLFSADDINKLIEIKTYLNSIADTNLRNPSYPKLFFEAAFLLNEREFKQDAIQYYKIVTENFPETLYSKRASDELQSLGIGIRKEEEDEEY